MKAIDTAELHRRLLDPRYSLPSYGVVGDMFTQRPIPYDPNRVTYNMTQDILDYIAEPPVDNSFIPDGIPDELKADLEELGGFTLWMTVLAGRQVSKSTTTEYGCYPKAAYSPGWDHVCIADTKSRAVYLHGRTHLLHRNWRGPKAKTVPHKERRQLTFEHGGGLRTLSAEDENVGIGQSPDSFHLSECGFWPDFDGTMFLIYPSLDNRVRCIVIFECTPWMSGGDWHKHWVAAKRREGRHFGKFYPFWDGIMNRRRWEPSWTMTNEEVALMEKYGSGGLTLEHLAFRRYKMDTDKKIRRNPELFKTFYPFDDLECWATSSLSSIPMHALLKASNRTPIMVDWDPKAIPWHVFKDPRPSGRYVIGVDPCGNTGRDHGAFVVLEVWKDHWEVVYSYSAHTGQIEFTDKLLEVAKKYNKAKIVIERNGEGSAIAALMVDRGYTHFMSDQENSYGIHVASQGGKYSWPRIHSHLIDALLDCLVIPDIFLFEQLQTYRRDKELEESWKAEVLRGGEPSKNRRPKSHWDLASALKMAVEGARTERQEEPPWTEAPPPITDFGPKLQWTKNEVDALVEKQKAKQYDGGTKTGGNHGRTTRPARLRGR